MAVLTSRKQKCNVKIIAEFDLKKFQSNSLFIEHTVVFIDIDTEMKIFFSLHSIFFSPASNARFSANGRRDWFYNSNKYTHLNV